MVCNFAQTQFTKAFLQVPCESEHIISWCFQVQLKPAGENPLSKFFTKMTDDKCRSKPGCSDPFRESLLTEVKEDEFGAKEKMSNYFIKNRAFPGEKRELEETGTDSGQTTEKVSNFTSNPVKKGRSNKNSGDKQATLLSYFGKS